MVYGNTIMNDSAKIRTIRGRYNYGQSWRLRNFSDEDEVCKKNNNE